MPSGPGKLEITITPNPVPWSSQPIEGCSLPNTWQYDQILVNSGGTRLTISDRTDSFDGVNVSTRTGLGIVLAPGAQFGLKLVGVSIVFFQLGLWGNALIEAAVRRQIRHAMAEDPADATTLTALGFIGSSSAFPMRCRVSSVSGVCRLTTSEVASSSSSGRRSAPSARSTSGGAGRREW